MPPLVEQADEAKERRLEQIRREAAETGRVQAPGVRAIGAPIPEAPLPAASAQTGYYGLPLLKQPPWIWTVPVYLFVGGAAGGSAVIAAVSRWNDEDPGIARHARLIALAGAGLSPILLVADLGRPARFLNMMRVFKPQSPMSVGVWTLIAFSLASGAAVAAQMARRVLGGERDDGRSEGPELRRSEGSEEQSLAGRALSAGLGAAGAAADTAAGITGLALVTYTGVLFGVTAIPVWARNVRLLPFHFGISGMASGVGLLELMGHHTEGMWRVAVGTSIAETAVGGLIEMNSDAALEPLRHGESGWLTRLGGALSGPIPLALRLFGRDSSPLRYAAAACSVAGSLITRFAWLGAGRISASDPRIPLGLNANTIDS